MPKKAIEPKPDFKARPLYTAKELGEILGLTDLTIRKWIREGRINSTKLSRYVRVSHDELMRLSREGLLPGKEKREK